MLTDSHCHLASHRFEPDEVPTIIDRALSAGVTRMVTLSTCLENLEPSLHIAQHPTVFTCLGIHPCDVTAAPDDAPDLIAAHLTDPRVCGVGETGLDYFHPAPEGWSEADYHARQRDFLRRHFEIAASAGLNVVIHTRDRSGTRSLDDALALYQDYHRRTCAVFHCFIADITHAQRVFDLGGIVSFGGVCTFKSAKIPRETATLCPAGSFLLETDAPYLAPEPHRGQRNEPAFTRHTAELLAAARGESLEQLATHTNAAADGFFRFTP
jgi:TatD DNase family protein